MEAPKNRDISIPSLECWKVYFQINDEKFVYILIEDVKPWEDIYLISKYSKHECKQCKSMQYFEQCFVEHWLPLSELHNLYEIENQDEAINNISHAKNILHDILK